jgi:hypothetical protein
MTTLRRRLDVLYKALNLDDQSVEQARLSPQVVLTHEYGDVSEMCDGIFATGISGAFIPPVNAARFSVVEIQALRGEVILWGCVSSVAVNWQWRHLVDDASPITNDAAVQVPSVWQPRGSRVIASLLATAPNHLFNVGTGAIVNYGAATNLYNATTPISTGFASQRPIRIPLGSALVAQHATLNTTFTLNVWGSWVNTSGSAPAGPRQ